MTKKQHRFMGVFGTIGFILQLCGVFLLFSRPSGTDVDLFWAITTGAMGLLIWMAILEALATARGRTRLWCLLAPLGPLALLYPKGHRIGQSEQPLSDQAPRSIFHRVMGLLLVGCITLGFMWAGSLWLKRNEWPPRLSEGKLREQEMATWERLSELVTAQRLYRERDWNNDGMMNYAQFLVHLWRSVDPEGHPVEVHLIPREFGIAMTPSWAVDGYFFTDLRRREFPDTMKLKDSVVAGRGAMIYEKIGILNDWAVCAEPADYGRTGFLMFLVDRTGGIFGKYTSERPEFYPYMSRDSGWIELPDEQALARLQDTVDYSL